MPLSDQDKDKIITAIIVMLLKVVTDYGVPVARKLLSSAIDAVGEIEILKTISGMFSGKDDSPESRAALLIEVQGVCLPLPQDALECHTPEGWRDANCDQVADKDQ